MTSSSELANSQFDRVRVATLDTERLFTSNTSVEDDHVAVAYAACYVDDTKQILDPTFIVIRKTDEQGSNTYVFGKSMGSNTLMGVSWEEGSSNIDVVKVTAGQATAYSSTSEDLIADQLEKLHKALPFDPSKQTVVRSILGRDKIVRKSVISTLAKAIGW